MKALFFDAGRPGQDLPRRADPRRAAGRRSRRWREQLFDVLTRHDEQDRITSAYLEGKEIPAETIRAVLREQTLQRVIQPVLCGSGREHIGIQPLLDA